MNLRLEYIAIFVYKNRKQSFILIFFQFTNYKVCSGVEACWKRHGCGGGKTT